MQATGVRAATIRINWNFWWASLVSGTTAAASNAMLSRIGIVIADIATNGLPPGTSR